MNELLSFDLEDGVATIAMDDAKRNVMSIAMLEALGAAFDRAEEAGAGVLLVGRPDCFSAGFDVKLLARGGESASRMVRMGAELAARVLGFPRPVVAACTGHAYPMGAFLLLAADRRLGAEGPYRIGLNEVAIGLTLPWFAIEVARQRLAPAYLQRAVTGDLYSPEEAVRAGFLDEIHAPGDVVARAGEVARGLAVLPADQLRATKERLRGASVEAMHAAIEREWASIPSGAAAAAS